ncbi:hypothetical protein [Parageobacillus sp. VR-IP]|nr:hypothetical protein [Parageobacillus sp. VR-IP]
MPKELVYTIKTKVKRHLVAVLGSMEESTSNQKAERNNANISR